MAHEWGVAVSAERHGELVVLIVAEVLVAEGNDGIFGEQIVDRLRVFGGVEKVVAFDLGTESAGEWGDGSGRECHGLSVVADPRPVEVGTVAIGGAPWASNGGSR